MDKKGRLGWMRKANVLGQLNKKLKWGGCNKCTVLGNIVTIKFIDKQKI